MVAPLQFAPSSLAGFLIRRALLNETLGNYFFWYVYVECNIIENEQSKLYVQIDHRSTERLSTRWSTVPETSSCGGLG